MLPVIRLSVAVVAAGLLLIGCGSRPSVTTESVREAAGSDSSAITKVEWSPNRAATSIHTNLDAAHADVGLRMCRAIHEHAPKLTVIVWGELLKGAPLFPVARTAKDSDGPGECEQSVSVKAVLGSGS